MRTWWTAAPTFVQLTAALDSIPIYVEPNKVVSIRVTRPGPDGDPGAQGTLIITDAAEPDNRIVVKEPVNIVVGLLSRHGVVGAPVLPSSPDTPPLPARRPRG